MRRQLKFIGAIILLAMVIAILAGFFYFRRNAGLQQIARFHDYAAWQFWGGDWSDNAGILSDTKNGRGDLALTRDLSWNNFQFSSDVRFDSAFTEFPYGDAGLVFRVTQPNQGVDSYHGYYAGLQIHDQMLLFGRAEDRWIGLESLHLKSPLTIGSWYHVAISAHNCRFSIKAWPSDGGEITAIDYTEPSCLPEGALGLRLYYVKASWKNLQATR